MKYISKALAGCALAGSALLAMTSCAAAPAHETATAQLQPDYPSYATIQDLAKRSTLVVEVTLGASSPDKLLPKYEGDDSETNPLAGTTEKPDRAAGAVPITVFAATVNTVYLGEVKPGEVINVGQLGGTMDGTEYTVTGSRPLQEGQTVILFLATYPDAPASILGGDAGVFTQVGDEYQSHAEQPLTITLDELKTL
ncbi:hypothetical protein [Paeniglutamicibacter cryotolerans]|uniref:Lipoprotein LpqN n=1 Tax=Paeniglutamicibacter cryotolerans TaxID=670079 RepID=A0A839QNM0_9MICC|nr:hypothetical protein [Paeniglutamicibacter cryotolerans]MBB2996225.1 hypothetical protein [Paeniglutamicibacter cryotolerans]